MRVGDKYFLVGGGTAGVNLLSELPASEIEPYIESHRLALETQRSTLMRPFERFRKIMTRRQLPWLLAGLAALFVAIAAIAPVLAQTIPGPTAPSVPIPQINVGVTPATKPSDVAFSLQILLLLTVLALAPTLLVLTTAFTRIVVVLSFVRTALGTQSNPPNQVLIGLAMFLTFFVMAPVIEDVNKNALQPYLGHKISQQVAFDRAQKPLRAFMFKQTREERHRRLLFDDEGAAAGKQDDVPTYLLIPAFTISELKTAFEIGFAIYIRSSLSTWWWPRCCCRWA